MTHQSVQPKLTCSWDAKAVPSSYNIMNLRSHQWRKCSMVHAYIRWAEENRSVDLFKGFFNSEIINPYAQGLVWFCKICFKIRCPHWFDVVTQQRVGDQHSHVEYNIGTCKFCGLKILLSAPGVCTPSAAALDLMQEALPDRSGYGSGWVCEAPVMISRIIEERGVEVAREHLNRMIRSGSCQDAFDHLHKFEQRSPL